MGRVIRELENALEKCGSRGKKSLELNFIHVTFTHLDTEELDARISGAFLTSPTPPIHVSFPCCEMEDEKAIKALEKFASNHPIESMNFSVTYFNKSQIERVVAAARRTVKKLHFTITYTEGIPMGIMDLYSNIDTDFIVMENYPLQVLELDAKSPMQRRLRLPRMQELSTILPRLRNVKKFHLSHCELDDEGLGLLVAGLITLRESLQEIKIQTERANLSPFALVCFSFLMEDMACLKHLNLDIQNSKRSLFEYASGIQLDRFLEALQVCRASLCLQMTNVGLNSSCVTQMIHALTRSQSTNVQLFLTDSNYISKDDVFVALRNALPELSSVSELSIIDTGEECTTLSPSEEAKIVEQLERNFNIQRFDLKLGRKGLNEQNPARVDLEEVLNRNAYLKKIQVAVDTKQETFEYLWPIAIERLQRESVDSIPSATYFVLKQLLGRWSRSDKICSTSSQPIIPIEDHVPNRRVSVASAHRGLKRSISTESLHLRQKRIQDALYYLDDSDDESNGDSSISSYSFSSSTDRNFDFINEGTLDSADKDVFGSVDPPNSTCTTTNSENVDSEQSSIYPLEAVSCKRFEKVTGGSKSMETSTSTSDPGKAHDQESLDKIGGKENKPISSHSRSNNIHRRSSESPSSSKTGSQTKKKSRKKKKEKQLSPEGGPKERKSKKKDTKKKKKKDKKESQKSKKVRKEKKPSLRSSKKPKKTSRSLKLLETVLEETLEDLFDDEGKRNASLSEVKPTSRASKSLSKSSKETT